MVIAFTQVWQEANIHIAIECAKKHSPKCRVILLGDEKQPTDLCEFYPIREYSRDARRYEQIFKHVGALPKAFELFCITRWLRLAEWMDKRGEGEQLFACDSDVLVFSELADVATQFADFDFTLSTDRKANLAHPGHMYILNPEALLDFREYVFNRKGEGGNDMSLWTDFSRAGIWNVGESTDVIKDATFEHHLGNQLDEYENDGTLKKVYWINGHPYGKRLSDGKPIRFHVLHAWGPAECRMREYVDAAKASETGLTLVT